jgi:hypothetical protein
MVFEKQVILITLNVHNPLEAVVIGSIPMDA